MARILISQLIFVIAFLPLVATFVQAFAATEPIQNGTMGHEKAWSYLRLLGYLNDTQNYDVKTFESALKLYQQIYHLNVTGELDPETINLISTPRCGFPDQNLINASQSVRGVHVSSFHALFKLGVTKWPPQKYNLTYKIDGGDPTKVGNDALLRTLKYAFQLWAKVSKFTFKHVVPSSPADLLISFQTGEHVPPPDKDLWAHGVLAYANPPTNGTMHLNAFVDWSFVPPGPKQDDLIWVVAHEIGHLLGIDHSENTNAIMYAYVTPGKTRRALHADDIAAIRAMYP